MNSNDRANLIKRINTLEGLTDKERSALDAHLDGCAGTCYY